MAGIAERDAKIVALDQVQADRSHEVDSLKASMREQEGRIVALDQALTDRSHEVAALKTAIANRESQIAFLQSTVRALRSSTSWRITAPLRVAKRMLRRLQRYGTAACHLLVHAWRGNIAITFDATADRTPDAHAVDVTTQGRNRKGSITITPPRPAGKVQLICWKQPATSGEVALFVTHSPDGRVKPHVPHYLDALRRHGIKPTLIIATDRPVPVARDELPDIVDGLYVRENQGFDFGAWAHVLREVPEFYAGQILYLLNDSVIGPLNEKKFEEVLRRLRASKNDVIGLTDNLERGWHIQSYFIALKSRALASNALREFFDNVKNLSDKEDVINSYEICLAPTLQAAGLSCDVLFPAEGTHNTSLFDWKSLVGSGFPFVKVAALCDSRIDNTGWSQVLQMEGFEPRIAEHAVAAASTVDGIWPIPRLAVLLHAYYIDTIPIFKSYFANIPFPFTLFISTDTEDKRHRIEREFAAWQNGRVEVRVMDNRGRDTAPKVIGFRDVYDEYPYVLQLHSKKSSHSNELTNWLNFLLDALLGSRQTVENVFKAFERRFDLGIVAPPIFPVTKQFMVWGPNFEICRSLAQRMGFSIAPKSPLDFPAGSMFWARSAALRPLLDLGLDLDEFPEEAGQTDGTLAHAIERIYFYVCELAGFSWTRDVSISGATLLPAATPRQGAPDKLVTMSGQGEFKNMDLSGITD
jgi:lipopolysaccharide biosynthesis protein